MKKLKAYTQIGFLNVKIYYLVTRVFSEAKAHTTTMQ
jgi:hypothetical protein